MEARIRLAVVLGGAAGSLGRVAVGAVLGVAALPVATLVVNLTGTAALAVLGVRLRDPVLRAGVLTGAIGAWTTVSGLALDTVRIVGDQRLATAAGYLVVTLGAGLAATVAGRAAARRTTDGGRA